MQLKEKSKARVDILGQEYVLKGSDPTEHLEEIGWFIARRTEEIQMKNSSYNPTKIAVLVCLQLADELHKLKEDYEKILEELKVLDKIHQMDLGMAAKE